MMTIYAEIVRVMRRLTRGIIHRLWVQPLEMLLIPYLYVDKPNWVQALLLRMFTWLDNAGRVLLEEVCLNIIRWAGPDWSVTYIGNGFSAEVLKSILFSEPPDIRINTSAFLWQVSGLVRKFSEEGDLVVCELNRIIRLSSKDYSLAFSAPQWVNLTIEGIDRPPEETLAEIHPPIRRRIRRLETMGYSSITSHSEADFDLFYNQMYVPYVETRHNAHGPIVRGHDYVHRFFEKGTLILVKQCEDFVSGAICEITGDTCLGVLMGVMEGRYELVKRGSNVALWWTMIQWARDQGARRFDLGASRPMITNGALDFKRQWGAQVYREKDVYTQWNFFAKNFPAKLRNYLNQLGFITETPEGHAQVLLLDPGKVYQEADLAHQLKSLKNKYGLAGIVMISATGERSLIPYSAVEVDPAGSAHLLLSESVNLA